MLLLLYTAPYERKWDEKGYRVEETEFLLELFTYYLMLFFSSLDWTFGFQSSMRAYSRTLWLLPWGAYYCRLVSYWDLGVGKKKIWLRSAPFRTVRWIVWLMHFGHMRNLLWLLLRAHWTEMSFKLSFHLSVACVPLAACSLVTSSHYSFLLNLFPFLTHVHTMVTLLSSFLHLR